MAEKVGDGYVEVTPSFEGFDRALRAGIQQALDRISATARGVGEDIESAFDEAATNARSALDRIGDDSSLDEVGRAAAREGEQVERAFDEASRESRASLGRIVGAVGLIGGALAGLGIGAGVGLAISQASDLNESLNAVNVTFGQYAEGIHAIGEEANTSLGLTQSQFNGVAVQFSSFAEKIAGDGGDVVGTINDLATRGADFASVMNLEVADALAVFQSGLAGETEPLKKFGIDLSAAAVEQYALANGIKTGTGEMTEAQKVQARYGLLMEQTNKTAGDFANTSDSLANGLRILKATATEAAASFGSALLPGLQGVVGAANEMATGLTAPLQQLGAVVGDALVPLFDALGPAIGTIVQGLVPVISNIGDVIGNLAPLLEPVAEVLAMIGSVVSNVLMRAFRALAPVIETVGEFLGEMADVAGDSLLAVFEALQPALDAVGQVLDDVLAAVLPIIVSLVRALAPILTTVANIFSQVLASVLPVIGDAFRRIGEALEPIVPLLGDALLSAFQALAPLLPVLVEAFARLAVSTADLLVALLPILEPLLQLVTILLDAAIAPAIIVIAEALERLTGALGFVIETVVGFVETVLGWFETLFDALVGNSIIPDLIEAIVDWFGRLPGMIVAALADLVSSVLGVFTRLVTVVADLVVEFISRYVEFYRELPGRIVSALSALGSMVAGAFSTAWTAVSSRVSQFIGDVVQFYRELPGRIVDALATVGSAIRGVFADAWFTVKERIQDFISDAVGLFVGLPGRIVSAIGDIAGAVSRAVGGAFQSGVNAAINQINDFLPNSVGLGPVSINLPDNPIPTLNLFAGGGIFDHPIFGMLGEDGTEALIPLTRPSRAAQLMDESGLTQFALARAGAVSGRGPLVEFSGDNHFYDGTDADVVAQKSVAVLETKLVAA